MSRLEKLVIDQGLIMVEEVQSPNSQAIYHGYTTKQGVKAGWGT